MSLVQSSFLTTCAVFLGVFLEISKHNLKRLRLFLSFTGPTMQALWVLVAQVHLSAQFMASPAIGKGIGSKLSCLCGQFVAGKGSKSETMCSSPSIERGFI